MARDYHHGDLPTALRAAAVEVIAESGPGGFSLREVARRADVSHAAPAHHFGDVEGLITSVAAEGFALITERVAAATETATDARARLIACGTAYVTTALANPGHYRVMISNDYVNENDETLLIESTAAYEQLLMTIRALRDEYNPDLDVDRTATLTWSAVHGLVQLAPILGHVAEATDTTANPIVRLIDGLADMIIDGIRPESAL